MPKRFNLGLDVVFLGAAVLLVGCLIGVGVGVAVDVLLHRHRVSRG